MNLRAGPLELELEGADLRYVCFGRLELVRRIYVAVRDEAWGTVPYECSPLELDRGVDRFRARFACAARGGAVAIDWTVTVEGLPTGVLRYRMEAQAQRAFAYNRIGICVLHPCEVTAGARYRATGGEGSLPLRIGPQPVVNGIARALFEPFRKLEIELDLGGRLSFAFDGDEFEMEDQRNWTDASFKTYSTPLARGVPHQAAAEQRFEQAVEVAFEAGEARARPRPDGLSITLGRPAGARLPALGLSLPSGVPAPSARARALLAALRLRHLRCDLRLETPATHAQCLAEARALADDLGALLELAVAVAGAAESELAELARLLAPHRDRLARVLVLPHDPDHPATSLALARAARAQLAPALPGVPLVAGTALDFAEVNRDASALGRLDAIAYSIDPQAHATDDRSLVETLAAQGETVASARALSGGLPVVVGPVTLGPRRAAQVDPRHASLFAAAWTVGSMHRLAQAGAESVTFFATTGPAGVVSAGPVLPLYHVLRTAGEWRDALLVPATSSDPLAVEALAVQRGNDLALLVANLQSHPVDVTIRPLPAGEVSLGVLAADSSERGCSDPEGFRDGGHWRRTGVGSLLVELPACATAQIYVE